MNFENCVGWIGWEQAYGCTVAPGGTGNAGSVRFHATDMMVAAGEFSWR